MTPEYLNELADMADPESLWRLSGINQMKLPEYQRRQLDAGVALRRHADHVRRLNELLNTNKSLVITPLSPGATATAVIDTPEAHKRMTRSYAKAL